MNTTTLEMRQADPPQKGGYRPQQQTKALVEVRRKQLHDNPDKWFVWQDNLPNRSYERKVAWLLMGLRQGSPMRIGELPYEFRLVTNEDGNAYTLYVRYKADAIQNPEANVTPTCHTDDN